MSQTPGGPGTEADCISLQMIKGTLGFYFITLGGDVKKLLNNVGSSTSAYSGGSAFSIGKNGAFTVTQCNPRNPGDIAAGMLNDGKVKILTAVNEDLFAGKQTRGS